MVSTHTNVVRMDTYGDKFEASLAIQIKVALVERGMSQKELAEAVHIEPATLSRYIKGHKSMPMPIFFRVAEALQVSPSELMNRAEARIQPGD